RPGHPPGTRPSGPYAGCVSLLTRVAKRLVIGRPVSSERLAETALSKRIALPIFASDALSSVTYATQEILLVLTVAGTAYLFVAPWVATGIVLLFAIVVASYRQVVRAYPDLNPVRVWLALGLVALLAAANLRGVRESGTAFAIPTYAFTVGVLLLI